MWRGVARCGSRRKMWEVTGRLWQHRPLYGFLKRQDFAVDQMLTSRSPPGVEM